jgi:hypothetical protein
MPIAVSWDEDDKSVLWFEITSAWTWADYHRGIDILNAMISGVTRRVDVICDMRNAEAPPLSAAISHTRSTLERLPHNHGVTAIIGAPSFVQALTPALQRIMPLICYKLIPARSVDDAYAIIAAQRILVT